MSTSDRDRSLGWWDQHRAAGRCAVCRKSLGAEDARRHPVHGLCMWLVNHGFRYKQVRAMTVAERVAAKNERSLNVTIRSDVGDRVQ